MKTKKKTLESLNTAQLAKVVGGIQMSDLLVSGVKGTAEGWAGVGAEASFQTLSNASIR